MPIQLKGRIDSGNAAELEAELLRQLPDGAPVVLDAAQLVYISSAGLRVLLRIRKNHPSMKIVNVNSEVYNILDMTGFTQMLQVEKAYHTISLDGCEEIGRGANGTLYRIGKDSVVKVYNNPDALDDIRHEREVARLALILGIPTAISYDVVRIGDRFGAVFELLNASSFSKILAGEPERLDWCVRESVDLLKKIHATVVPDGKLPDMRQTALEWAACLRDYLPAEAGAKLAALMEAVPQDDHMLHGDYHTKNLELQGDEVLLIDMDTLSVGHPIFELAGMFNAYIGFAETDHGVTQRFQGYSYETGAAYWHGFLAAYLGTHCERKLREVEDKARVIAYARLMRRTIRHGRLDTEDGRAQFAHWKQELLDLLGRIDTLTFSPEELELPADAENLYELQDFVDERLAAGGVPQPARLQLAIAVEEIFINIASYAYGTAQGSAGIRVTTDAEARQATLIFTDRGTPYDPLAKPDPDVTEKAQSRDIGGLGIYLSKQLTDEASYVRRDGQNVLTLRKAY